jgi:hypothetical protein
MISLLSFDGFISDAEKALGAPLSDSSRTTSVARSVSGNELLVVVLRAWFTRLTQNACGTSMSMDFHAVTLGELYTDYARTITSIAINQGAT